MQLDTGSTRQADVLRFARASDSIAFEIKDPGNPSRSFELLPLNGNIAVYSGATLHATLQGVRKSENPCPPEIWCGAFERIE